MCVKRKTDLENTILSSTKELTKLAKIILGASSVEEVISLGYTRHHIDLAFKYSQHLGFYEFNGVQYKRCGRCLGTKPVSEFGINRQTSSGYKSHCKDCASKILKNKTIIDTKWSEKEKERKRLYKEQNREEIRKKERERYAKKIENITPEEKYKLRLKWKRGNIKRAIKK